MTVRIPISADAGNVTTALDRIREAIRRAGQEGRDFAKLDLSHPELKDFAADLRRIQDQVERLTREARGATAAAARNVAQASGYDGRNGSPFAPGGMFDPTRWQQHRPDDWQRHYVNAGRYVLGGTSFAPAPPAPPINLPNAGQAAQQGSSLLASAGGSAMSGAASLMRGFLPAMLAMAGLSAVGNMVGQGVQQAGSEAIANDRLLRNLRDLNTDFDLLRNSVRDTTAGLGLTYEEAQNLAASWTTLANATDANSVTSGVRLGAGFARGYGMDPGAATAGFARAAFLGEDPRRFAGILADAISSSGMTGRPQEVMETLLRFQESNARRLGAANGTELFAGAYATLSSSGIPGLRGAGAEALLGQVNQAVMAGGGAGDASQFLTWRALSRHGNTDVFQQQYALAGGMFGGVNGGAAGPGNATIFEAMNAEVQRLYPGQADGQRYRRYHALGRHFGISPRQAEALESALGSGGFGALGGALSGAGISIGDLNPTAIRDAAEIAAPGADLARWRTTITGRLGADDPNRARLAGLEGEDLRRALLQVVAVTGRGETQGSQVEQSMADFSNALTRTGTGLLPILTDMRDALSALTNVAGALTNNIGDGYLAMFGNPEQRAAAQARLAARMGGEGAGALHAPGSSLPPPALSDPERNAAARALYQDARNAGHSHEHASALVAQVDVESGFSPNATHDGGIGFGLLGWNNNGETAARPGRLSQLGYFVANRRGMATPAGHAAATALGRTATAEEQRAFYLHEVGPNGPEHANARNFRNAQSAGEAGAALSRDVVRPLDRVGNMARRGALAERYARTLGPQGEGAAPSSEGTPLPPPPPEPPPPPISEAEAALIGLTGVGPGTPAPAAGPAGVRGTPVPIIERDSTARGAGQQSSLSFDPLRVIVENGRGDTIQDQFLGLRPPTGGGPPRPWGAA